MLDPNICTKWIESSKIDYNFFDSRKKKETTVSFDDLLATVKKLKKEKIVINSGHFIPDVSDPNYMGKNPLKLWDIACQIAAKFDNCYLTVLINDLPLNTEDRKHMSYGIPPQYAEIMKKYNLGKDRIIFDSANKNCIYAEKRLSNRIDWLLRKTDKLKNYNEKEMENYCVEAIVGYLQDIKKQGATISLWLLPKCSHENYLNATKMFDKNESGLIHLVYLETTNCYL